MDSSKEILEDMAFLETIGEAHLSRLAALAG